MLAAIEAGASSGTWTEDYATGGAKLRFVYRSPVLYDLLAPALAHLRVAEGAEQAVTLTLTDRSSLSGAPKLPWGEEEYRACGEIPGFIEGSHYVHLNLPMAALTVFDEAGGRAGYWCRQPAKLPSYELAGPVRAFFNRYFTRSRGMPLLHAAGVALDGKAILIIGPKGAGKSTTTLACLAAGLGYLGDDKVIGDPRALRVFSLYSTAKFHANERDTLPLARFRDFIHPPRTPSEGKALLYVDQVAPKQMATAARIAAIVACRVSGEERSMVDSLDPAVALRLLTADNIGMFPSSAAATLDSVASLCRQVPCLRLNAGRNLSEVADTVAALLSRS
jgi:hypothetical protein